MNGWKLQIITSVYNIATTGVDTSNVIIVASAALNACNNMNYYLLLDIWYDISL